MFWVLFFWFLLSDVFTWICLTLFGISMFPSINNLILKFVLTILIVSFATFISVLYCGKSQYLSQSISFFHWLSGVQFWCEQSFQVFYLFHCSRGYRLHSYLNVSTPTVFSSVVYWDQDIWWVTSRVRFLPFFRPTRLPSLFLLLSTLKYLGHLLFWLIARIFLTIFGDYTVFFRTCSSFIV